MAKCREGEGKWIGLNYFVCQNGKWVKTKTGLPKPKRRKPKARATRSDPYGLYGKTGFKGKLW